MTHFSQTHHPAALPGHADERLQATGCSPIDTPMDTPREIERFRRVRLAIDVLTGLSLAASLATTLAARQTPAPARTFSYGTFFVLCLVQGWQASNANITRRLIVADGEDKSQLAAANKAMMQRGQQYEFAQMVTHRQAMLRQIHAIPNQRDQIYALKVSGLATGELGRIVAAYERQHGVVPIPQQPQPQAAPQQATVSAPSSPVPSTAPSAAPSTAPVASKTPLHPKHYKADKPVPTAFESLTVRDAAADYLKGYQNLIVAGESGTGKSNFVLRLIELAIHQGQTIYILDAKNSAIYTYVREKYPQQIHYLECGGELGHEDALNRLAYLIEQMMGRDDAMPNYRDVLVIVDEYNIILDAGVETKIPSGERTYSAATKARMRKLMNQGRTRQHRVVITSHTTSAKALGTQNASYQMLALARCGDFSSVDSFLSSYQGDDKKRVEETVNGLRDVIDDVPISVTSIPKAGAYKLPYCPRDGRGYPLSEDVADLADAVGADEDSAKALDIAGALTYLRQQYEGKDKPSPAALWRELDAITPDYDLSSYFDWAPVLPKVLGCQEEDFAQNLQIIMGSGDSVVLET